MNKKIIASLLLAPLYLSSVFAYTPGISITSPTGYVASWGDIFGTIGGQVDIPSGNGWDGWGGVGFGLGNPYRYLGATISLNVGSLTDDGGYKAFDGGWLNAAVGHYFYNYATAASVGVLNIAGWHDESDKMDPSVYGAVTKLFDTRMPLFATVGVGNRLYSNKKGFRSGGSYLTGSDWGVFGALALVVTPRLNVIADYTARALSAGISIIPIRALPCNVGLSLYDLTEAYNTYDQVRFYGTLSCAANFA